MADTIGFNEGKDYILTNGAVTRTATFLLSTKDTTILGATDTFATVSEITGWTGASAYARVTQTVPAASNGILTFSQITWQTGAATDGPATCKSVVMALPGLTAVYAWNLQVGGTNFPLNTINGIIQFTPVFFLQNVGGS